LAERNEKVLAYVRAELGRNPQLGSRELYEKARAVESEVTKDTLQQFHARYVLPIKRQARSGEPSSEAAAAGAKRQKRSPNSQPEARHESLRRAEEVGGSETRKRQPRKKKGLVEGSDRDRIREVLLDFARDFSGAESRSEIVQVLSRIDEYVNRIAAGQ